MVPWSYDQSTKEIQQNLKLVDIVLELRDARAPFSTGNPKLTEIIGAKKHIIVLTKRDLADEYYSQKWQAYFRKQGQEALVFDVHKDRIDILVKKKRRSLG